MRGEVSATPTDSPEEVGSAGDVRGRGCLPTRRCMISPSEDETESLKSDDYRICAVVPSASARTYDCLAGGSSPSVTKRVASARCPPLDFQHPCGPCFDVAFPSHLACMRSAVAGHLSRLPRNALSEPEGRNPEGDGPSVRSEIRRSFLRQDGTLNLQHKCFRDRYLHLLLNDRFHAFLELKWSQLVAVIFLAFFVTAAVLAVARASLLTVLLYVATGGDCEGCLGKCQSPFDFYFFAAETMLAIGYGSPRFPACTAASALVLPFSVCGLLLNSLVLGVVFQKFSAANKRKWAIAFSEKLVLQTQLKRSTTLQRQDTAGGSPQKLFYNRKESSVSTEAASCGAKPTGLLEPLLSCDDAAEINITATSFFKPRLSLYLIIHRRDGLSIRQFSAFHTDSPLEFLALPITVTVLSTDVDSPLKDVTPEELRQNSHQYELLVLLSFTDNRTSKTVEVAKSWRLSAAAWNESFVPVVRPSGPFSSRAFEVDVDSLSRTRPSSNPKVGGGGAGG